MELSVLVVILIMLTTTATTILRPIGLCRDYPCELVPER